MHLYLCQSLCQEEGCLSVLEDLNKKDNASLFMLISLSVCMYVCMYVCLRGLPVHLPICMCDGVFGCVNCYKHELVQ